MCRQWPCPSDWTARRLDSASEMSCRYRQNHETTRQNADIFQLYQRQWCKTTIPIMVKIWSNHEQDIDKDKDWIDTLRSQLEFKAHLESSSSTLLSIANASETSNTIISGQHSFLGSQTNGEEHFRVRHHIRLHIVLFQRAVSCMERIPDCNVRQQQEIWQQLATKQDSWYEIDNTRDNILHQKVHRIRHRQQRELLYICRQSYSIMQTAERKYMEKRSEPKLTTMAATSCGHFVQFPGYTTNNKHIIRSSCLILLPCFEMARHQSRARAQNFQAVPEKGLHHFRPWLQKEYSRGGVADILKLCTGRQTIRQTKVCQRWCEWQFIIFYIHGHG